MYLPQHFEETDLATLHALVRAHPLATWVTQQDGELVVNHVPFLLDPARGQLGTLAAHVARANPVWQSPAPSIVVFQGPQTYITPSWYPSKAEHGKVVPTWNYAVVHAHGTPRVIDDKEWLLAHVSAQTDLRESQFAAPWKVTDAPPDYVDGMLRGIVGIEMPIEKLVGKWKVSQNRPEADRAGVIAGLGARDDAQSAGMARLVKEAASRD